MEAGVLREELLRGRVVHVDRMPVRHVDADLAERIDGAWILAQRVVHRRLGRPVEALRIDLLTLRVEDADLHLVEIGGIFAHMRDDVLLDERDRHRPGRVEVDGRDARLDDRRGAVHLADDRDIAARDLSALDRLDGRGGNVDHDVAVAEGEARAGKPLRGGSELAMARECRDVDRLERRVHARRRIPAGRAGPETV